MWEGSFEPDLYRQSLVRRPYWLVRCVSESNVAEGVLIVKVCLLVVQELVDVV